MLPPRMRLPTTSLLLACAVLGGCAMNFAPGADRGPIESLQRVLAIDFSTSAVAHRQAGIELAVHGLGHEAARLGKLTEVPGKVAHKTGTRLAAVSHDSVALLARELSPEFSVPPGAEAHFSASHYAQSLADNLADLPVIFGVAHRPMGEHDDLRHRTDPHDDHPEATFLERLRRRLLL